MTLKELLEDIEWVLSYKHDTRAISKPLYGYLGENEHGETIDGLYIKSIYLVGDRIHITFTEEELFHLGPYSNIINLREGLIEIRDQLTGEYKDNIEVTASIDDGVNESLEIEGLDLMSTHIDINLIYNN